ncbi:MAG: hypothetical protein CR967_04685 [Proteobacteria bacterium]|nr:MAG: hypothetical protein CR967_04685 [Pseudomonadota bacterium]
MENYILFDKTIKGLNGEPFLAGRKLFDLLDISYVSGNAGDYDMDFEKRFLNPSKFYDIFKPTLLDATTNNKTIIALENNAYLSLCEAKKYLDLDTRVVLAYEILLEKLSNNSSQKIVHHFDKFNVGVYGGVFDNLDQTSVSKLLKLIKAKEIKLKTRHENDGYSILDLDKNMSFEMAGDIVFDAYDSGCDFLIVNDICSFTMFDKYQKQIEKIKKRPLAQNSFTILSIFQVLLMALGKIKPEENLSHKNTIKPSFI